MILNKELTDLTKRLERIFPLITIHYEGEYFKDKNGFVGEDFSPPREIDWFEIVERLKKDGLEIKNIKEK